MLFQLNHQFNSDNLQINTSPFGQVNSILPKTVFLNHLKTSRMSVQTAPSKPEKFQKPRRGHKSFHLTNNPTRDQDVRQQGPSDDGCATSLNSCRLGVTTGQGKNQFNSTVHSSSRWILQPLSDCHSGENQFNPTKIGRVCPAICNPDTEIRTRSKGFRKHCFKPIFSRFKIVHLQCTFYCLTKKPPCKEMRDSVKSSRYAEHDCISYRHFLSNRLALETNFWTASKAGSARVLHQIDK